MAKITFLRVLKNNLKCAICKEKECSVRKDFSIVMARGMLLSAKRITKNALKKPWKRHYIELLAYKVYHHLQMIHFVFIFNYLDIYFYFFHSGSSDALKLYTGLIIFVTSTVGFIFSKISSIGLYTNGASSFVSSLTEVV